MTWPPVFGDENGRVFRLFRRRPHLGETWRREVQAAFPDYAVGMISLPLSICCHTGEGAVGVACAKLW